MECLVESSTTVGTAEVYMYRLTLCVRDVSSPAPQTCSCLVLQLRLVGDNLDVRDERLERGKYVVGLVDNALLLLSQVGPLLPLYVHTSLGGLSFVGRTLSFKRSGELGCLLLDRRFVFGRCYLLGDLLGGGHFLLGDLLFSSYLLGESRLNAIKERSLFVSRLSPCRLGFRFLLGALCLLVCLPQALPFVIELNLLLGLFFGKDGAEIIVTVPRRFITRVFNLLFGSALLLELSHTGHGLVVLLL